MPWVSGRQFSVVCCRPVLVSGRPCQVVDSCPILGIRSLVLSGVLLSGPGCPALRAPVVGSRFFLGPRLPVPVGALLSRRGDPATLCGWSIFSSVPLLLFRVVIYTTQPKKKKEHKY